MVGDDNELHGSDGKEKLAGYRIGCGELIENNKEAAAGLGASDNRAVAELNVQVEFESESMRR